MKVTITHAAKTSGLLKKTTLFEVSVNVQFSPQERAAIDAYGFAEVSVLPREPPATLRGKESTSDWDLLVKNLSNDAYLCATPAEAKTYDAKLRASLENLKGYLDENAVPMTGTTTYEL